VRSSRFGASSISEHSPTQCRNFLGGDLFGLVRNDVEREDKVTLVVVAADHVDHVDVEGAQFGLIKPDADVLDVDAWLPPVQSGAHVARDRCRRRGVGRRKQVILNPAAEFGAHGPFARRGTQDDLDGLLDLSRLGCQRYPTGCVNIQRETPSRSDEIRSHTVNLQSKPLAPQVYRLLRDDWSYPRLWLLVSSSRALQLILTGVPVMTLDPLAWNCAEVLAEILTVVPSTEKPCCAVILIWRP